MCLTGLTKSQKPGLITRSPDGDGRCTLNQQTKTRSNVYRVDFGSGRAARLNRAASSSYDDFAAREAPRKDAPVLIAPVTNLALVRDKSLGSRLGEFVGLICRDRKISLFMAVRGDDPVDARWCQQLVCTIHDAASDYRCGAPIGVVQPTETGKFVCMTTFRLPCPAPTPSEISPDTVVRLVGPRRLDGSPGWTLKAKFSQLERYKVGP